MSKKTNNSSYEANTLAMLDSTGAKDNHDANEDRLQYLEAVRAASLVPENGIPPTNKMYQAILRVLRFGRTLELVTASFQLLIQLHQRFPWVYVSDSDANGKHRLEVVDEAWSPFNFGSDVDSDEKETSLRSSWFQQLIQNMNKGVKESEESDLKMLGNMFVFEYLVHVLKLDFTPRNQVYEETMNWSLLKESSLNLLLASRRVNFKLLVKDFLSTMCALVDAGEKSISLIESRKGTLSAMKELLIMELDASKKKADMEGVTNRGDGVRTPAVEIILDELTYDGYLLSNFLQVFDDPKWKLEIVLQYLTKYIPKLQPSVRTRRSNVPQEEDLRTLTGVLNKISNGTNMKNITKKIGADIVQILIGHAFLARLSFANRNEDDSTAEICSSIITAYTNLKRVDRKIEILPLGKEVLFTAEMILKAKA